MKPMEDKMSNIDERDETQISLFDLLRTFWSGRRVILLITCVAVILAILVSFFAVIPQYRARSTIVISPPTITPAPLLERVTILEPFDGFVQLTQDEYIFLLKSDLIVQETMNILDLDMEASELSEAITVSKVPSTTFVEISVQHPDPDIAVDIANTLVLVYQREMQDYYYQANLNALSLASNQLEEAHRAVQNKRQALALFTGVDIELLIMELQDIERLLRSDKDRLTMIDIQIGIDRAYIEMLIDTELVDEAMQIDSFDIITDPNLSSSSQSRNYSINIRSNQLSDVMILSDYLATIMRLQRYDYEQLLLIERIEEYENQIEDIRQYLSENEDDYYAIKNDIDIALTTVRAYQQRLSELETLNTPGAFDSIIRNISPSASATRIGPNWVLNIAVSLLGGLLLGMFVVLAKQRLTEEGIIKIKGKENADKK